MWSVHPGGSGWNSLGWAGPRHFHMQMETSSWTERLEGPVGGGGMVQVPDEPVEHRSRAVA